MRMLIITPTEPGHTSSFDCPCKPKLSRPCPCRGENPRCIRCHGEGDIRINYPEENCLLTHNQIGNNRVQWKLTDADVTIEECHADRN